MSIWLLWVSVFSSLNKVISYRASWIFGMFVRLLSCLNQYLSLLLKHVCSSQAALQTRAMCSSRYKAVTIDFCHKLCLWCVRVSMRSAPQSCLTLCDLMDCSPPGGISQARTLEQFAISYSRGSSWPRDGTCLLPRQAGCLTLCHLGSLWYFRH